MADLVPLEYRCALDAAMTCVAADGPVLALCEVAALGSEVQQRVPVLNEEPTYFAGLWVEPQVPSWRDRLQGLAGALAVGSRMAVISSLPPAQFLPGRRGWADAPLGFRAGGLVGLRRALWASGFQLETRYGLHSVQSIILNYFAALAERFSRPDLADRLSAAGRLLYCQRLFHPWLAACELALFRKYE